VIARRGLPVADAAALGGAARRARLLRTTLLATVAVLLGAAVVLAGRSKPATAAPVLAARDSTTEIVLDVSGSVGNSTYAFTERTLERLSRSTGGVGLIVFSDSAEEALPPGTPPEELRPIARLFHPLKHPQPSPSPPLLSKFPLSPWYASFSGGTRMSAGIAAAREALARDHARGRVVLISDLGEALDDLKALRRELVRLAGAGIELRVLPLPTTFRRDVQRFRRLEGPQVAQDALPPLRRTSPARDSAAVPVALAAVALLLALALAANELYGVSLRWRETG
jgi:hypothetical protein